MKFLIFLVLALNIEASAQKNLSSDYFQSNVRPVLSGILSDFYQMISLFPDYPKDLIQIIDEVDELHSEKNALVDTCPHDLNRSCLTSINKLRLRLVSLQSKTLKLISNQQITTGLHINPIGGIRTTLQFQAMLESIKGDLDNSSFIMKAGAKQKKSTYPLVKKMDDLSTYISLTVVEYVPFLYQNDFRHFYFNFIHPIQQQIGKNKNYEFLNRNINSLNFAINLLNQNLTKRNKKTPDGMAPYLSLMHNRWNSLLRYYF